MNSGTSAFAHENHDYFLFPCSPDFLLHLHPSSMFLGSWSYLLHNYLLCKENTTIVSASGQELSGSFGQAMGISPLAFYFCIYLSLAEIYMYKLYTSTSGINKYTVLFYVAQSPYNE